MLDYDLPSGQIATVQAEIEARAEANDPIPLLRSPGKMGAYTALALRAHMGPIERFPTAPNRVRKATEMVAARVMKGA